MTEHAKITVFLHQCSSLTTTVSHIIAVFRVRQCFANKNKNCASQDCSASHHCRLVSNLFEIRHAKHLWFPHAKKNFPSHITRPPFKLASSGDVQTNKTKTVPPATQLSLGKSCTMQVKTKTFVWFRLFPCDMQQKHKHAQGFFRPARTAAKMAFASSLLYTPVAVQLTSYIPACFSHSHQPKRFVSKLQKPADALQKISTLPIGNPFGACIPV
jgi:hypothetical protein